MCDSDNLRVRRIDSAGTITTIAGTIPIPTRVDAPPDATTFDLRTATYTGDGTIDAVAWDEQVIGIVSANCQYADTGLR